MGGEPPGFGDRRRRRDNFGPCRANPCNERRLRQSKMKTHNLWFSVFHKRTKGFVEDMNTRASWSHRRWRQAKFGSVRFDHLFPNCKPILNLACRQRRCDQLALVFISSTNPFVRLWKTLNHKL